MPVELCHVHEPGDGPKVKFKTPKKEKVKKPASARKRKRTPQQRTIESEDEDELYQESDEEPDWSQLDRYTDGDEELPTPAPKRQRRMTRSAATSALASIQESPPAKDLQ